MVRKLPEKFDVNEFLDLRRTDPVELFAEELTWRIAHTRDDEADNRIATLLKEAGLNTYGDVLDYAKEHFFSDLAGVDPHTAELIHRQIESAEALNKTQVLLKLHRTQSALAQLAKLSKELVADLTKERYE